jgi:hypothetical protein
VSLVYISWVEYECDQAMLAAIAYGKVGNTKSARGGCAADRCNCAFKELRGIIKHINTQLSGSWLRLQLETTKRRKPN